MRSEKDLTQIVLDWSVAFMRRSMHDFTRYTRDTGLTIVQMTVLFHLYYRGPSEVLIFSELMQVSAAGASQMVERMVQQGIVTRSESPDDRRVRLVALTAEGRRLVEASIAARQKWMEELLATLTPTEQDSIAGALSILTERAAQIEKELEPD